MLPIRCDYCEALHYLPSCADFGDFDATSAAIAIFPCGRADALPQPACASTFERYYEFFRARRAAEVPWENYAPYEVRLVGAFVWLGQPERALPRVDRIPAGALRQGLVSFQSGRFGLGVAAQVAPDQRQRVQAPRRISMVFSKPGVRETPVGWHGLNLREPGNTPGGDGPISATSK